MAAVAAPVERTGLLRQMTRRRTVMAGLVVLAIVALLALLAPLIAPYAPNRLSIANRLKPPGATFWFGTDEFGRASSASSTRRSRESSTP